MPFQTGPPEAHGVGRPWADTQLLSESRGRSGLPLPDVPSVPHLKVRPLPSPLHSGPGECREALAGKMSGQDINADGSSQPYNEHRHVVRTLPRVPGARSSTGTPAVIPSDTPTLRRDRGHVATPAIALMVRVAGSWPRLAPCAPEPFGVPRTRVPAPQSQAAEGY